MAGMLLLARMSATTGFQRFAQVPCGAHRHSFDAWVLTA